MSETAVVIHGFFDQLVYAPVSGFVFTAEVLAGSFREFILTIRISVRLRPKPSGLVFDDR